MSFPLASKPTPHDPFSPKSNVKRSKSQEKRIEIQTKGKRQPASGAFPTMKGDVKTVLPNEEELLIEAKTTITKSHSLTIKRLMKISDEAAQLLRSPAYYITFENMPFPYEKDWILFPASMVDWKK